MKLDARCALLSRNGRRLRDWELQHLRHWPLADQAGYAVAPGAYLPDTARRQEITATPLNASLDQLRGLPDALIIVDENDVLRDEGEAYARKLSQAGVRVTSVRYNGTIHDFVLLNPIADTPAVRGALQQANDALRAVLHS